jgi:hypothetical protein
MQKNKTPATSMFAGFIVAPPVFISILEFNRVLITIHSTKVYSNITNDKMYDQIVFLPSIKSKIQKHGVFDYETKIFNDLWKSMSPLDFRAYLRYYISDHSPLWMQLEF